MIERFRRITPAIRKANWTDNYKLQAKDQKNHHPTFFSDFRGTKSEAIFSSHTFREENLKPFFRLPFPENKIRSRFSASHFRRRKSEAIFLSHISGGQNPEPILLSDFRRTKSGADFALLFPGGQSWELTSSPESREKLFWVEFQPFPKKSLSLPFYGYKELKIPELDSFFRNHQNLTNHPDAPEASQ